MTFPEAAREASQQLLGEMQEMPEDGQVAGGEEESQFRHPGPDDKMPSDEEESDHGGQEGSDQGGQDDYIFDPSDSEDPLHIDSEAELFAEIRRQGSDEPEKTKPKRASKPIHVPGKNVVQLDDDNRDPHDEDEAENVEHVLKPLEEMITTDDNIPEMDVSNLFPLYSCYRSVIFRNYSIVTNWKAEVLKILQF
jgi:hypothetical protein